MNPERILQIAVVLFLSQVIFGTSVLAQERIVGVSPSESFTYGDISFQWITNDPNMTRPFSEELWRAFNETESVTMTIQEASGTNVTFQTTIHIVNGSEITSSGFIDIDTGASENATLMGASFAYNVISAGLTEGDSLYSAGEPSEFRINETIVRTYPDDTRETNHLNLTAEETFVDLQLYWSLNYYWDRATGILVEFSSEWKAQRDEYTSTWLVTIKITQSNVWVVPEFPTWTLVFIFIALTSALLLYKRRSLRTPTR